MIKLHAKLKYISSTPTYYSVKPIGYHTDGDQRTTHTLPMGICGKLTKELRMGMHEEREDLKGAMY